MASSNHPKTFADLYGTALNNLRQDSSVTATVNEAKRMINSALYDMVQSQGENFTWCHRRTVLITQQDYNTGTATVSQGSTSVTGASTLWNTANAFSATNARAGGKIVFAGQMDVYEVASVESDTGLTLSNAYVGSDLSAKSYLYFEDTYALTNDFLRPLDMKFFDAARSIALVGERDFRMKYVRNATPGKPQVATTIDAPFSGSTARVRKVIFHQPPDDFYQIPYAYVTSNLGVTSAGAEQAELSSDTDEPIVPLELRMAIVHKAMGQWYTDRSDDLPRAQANEQLYSQIMNRATSHVEIGQQLPRLIPRITPYQNRARYPYRGSGSRRHVAGTAFDELRD